MNIEDFKKERVSVIRMYIRNTTIILQKAKLFGSSDMNKLWAMLRRYKLKKKRRT